MKIVARITAFLSLACLIVFIGLHYIPVDFGFAPYFSQKFIDYYIKCATYVLYSLWTLTVIFLSFAKCKHHKHDDECCHGQHHCCCESEVNENQPKRRVNSIKSK